VIASTLPQFYALHIFSYSFSLSFIVFISWVPQVCMLKILPHQIHDFFLIPFLPLTLLIKRFIFHLWPARHKTTKHTITTSRPQMAFTNGLMRTLSWSSRITCDLFEITGALHLSELATLSLHIFRASVFSLYGIYVLVLVMPHLRRLVADLPSRRPKFDPRSSHVEFVVGKVALGQVFSEYLEFPCQFSFHRLLNTHYLIIQDWYSKPNSGRRTKWPQFHSTLRNI
jgi:hypothetical protein